MMMNLLMNFEPSRSHTESVTVLVCDSDAQRQIIDEITNGGP